MDGRYIMTALIAMLIMLMTLQGCGGSGSSDSGFMTPMDSVTASPSVTNIANISNAGQPIRTGDWIAVQGSGFGSSQGNGALQFVFEEGGQPRSASSISHWTDSEITGQVPSASAFSGRSTSYPVIIVTKNDGTVSNYLFFSYDPSPAPSPTTSPDPTPSPAPSPTSTPSPLPTPTADPGPGPGPGPVPTPSPTPDFSKMAYQGPQLNDIYGEYQGALYAVGNQNTIIRNTEGSWQSFPSSGIEVPEGTDWSGITGDGQYIYIGGTGGIIVRYSEGTWEMDVIESEENVKDVTTRGWRKSASTLRGYGFEEADAWAITESALWQHDESGWNMVENPEGAVFSTMIYDFTADTIYIAGSQDGKACVFEYNGTLNNIFTDGPLGGFHGVTHYFGVIRFTCGDGGNLFYSGGLKGSNVKASWTAMNTSVSQKLLSLFVPIDMRDASVPPTEEMLYATGSEGNVLKFSLGEDGDFSNGKWAAMKTDTTQSLRSMWTVVEEPPEKSAMTQNRSGLIRHLYVVGGDGGSGLILQRQVEIE